MFIKSKYIKLVVHYRTAKCENFSLTRYTSKAMKNRRKNYKLKSPMLDIDRLS